MRILITPTFERAVKKLHRQQKADLDAAVQAIASDTEIGEGLGRYSHLQVQTGESAVFAVLPRDRRGND